MNRKIWIPVVVGALGYFVDIYDLILFSIVRVPSLKGIGVADKDILDVGVLLLNSQMGGMLIGGIIWGVLGDKRGRLSVLFGSIFLYSVANIINGFVTTVPAYAVMRFISGIGLAGELGAAITLVSETLPTHIRGYGTGLVAGVGLSGAVFAGVIANHIAWNWAFVFGGVLGLLLLVLRIGIFESKLFEHAKAQNVKRGDFASLFTKTKFLKYFSCIAVGFPIWFVVGILVTFSPEIAKELGVAMTISAGKGIMYCYAGIAIGDVVSGFLSQLIKSRKKVVIVSLGIEALLTFFMLSTRGMEESTFYWVCFSLGLATGYWAVFVTIASEQFGTNLRSTVTTTVPNFVRGSVVLMTLLFKELSHHTTLVHSAATVGVVTMVLGLIGILNLEESYSKDLNYVEA